MGSITRAIKEAEDEKQFKKDQKYLLKLSEAIKDIKPGSAAWYDIKFIQDHKKQILDHKQLIKML